MKNIVLTRIDDRLLHGQVVVSWIPFSKADEVVIVDDEYSKDEFMSQIIKNAAPNNIDVKVLSTEEASSYLKSDDNGSRILILSRYIENVDELIKSNVAIDSLNVGGLGSGKGRERCLNSIHLNRDEINLLKNMEKRGIKVELKTLPKDRAVTVEQVSK